MSLINELLVKLSKYIISRDDFPDLPRTLDSEVLLEVTPHGVLTVSIKNLAMIIAMRDNPMLRPDVTIPDGKYKRRNLRTLTRDEFEELIGYKKYFDRWRREGIKI